MDDIYKMLLATKNTKIVDVAYGGIVKTPMWSSLFPVSAAGYERLQVKILDMIRHLEKFKSRVEKIPHLHERHKKILDTLYSLKEEQLRMYIGVSNTSEERLAAIKGLVAELKECVRSDEWRNLILQANEEYLRAVRENDLKLVQKFEREALEQQREFIEEFEKTMQELANRIKQYLADIQKQLDDIDTKIKAVQADIADLQQNVEVKTRQVHVYVVNYSTNSHNVSVKYGVKSLSAKDFEDITHKHIQEVGQTAGLSDVERAEKVTAKVEAEMRSRIEKDAGYSALSVDQKAQLEQELMQARQDLGDAVKGGLELEPFKQKLKAKQKELDGLREERDRLGEQKTKQEALLHQVEQRHSAKEAEALSTASVDAAAPTDTGASSKVPKRETPPSTKTANAAATAGAEAAKPKTPPPKAPRSSAPTPIPKPR